MALSFVVINPNVRASAFVSTCRFSGIENEMIPPPGPNSKEVDSVMTNN